jgi:hypothetical protein
MAGASSVICEPVCRLATADLRVGLGAPRGVAAVAPRAAAAAAWFPTRRPAAVVGPRAAAAADLGDRRAAAVAELQVAAVAGALGL